MNFIIGMYLWGKYMFGIVCSFRYLQDVLEHVPVAKGILRFLPSVDGSKLSDSCFGMVGSE